MEMLKERRRCRARQDGGKTETKPMRVRLMKQRRGRAAQSSSANEEAVEYVGSDDGLPTAIMVVDAIRRNVKLDSCASYQ